MMTLFTVAMHILWVALVLIILTILLLVATKRLEYIRANKYWWQSCPGICLWPALTIELCDNPFDAGYFISIEIRWLNRLSAIEIHYDLHTQADDQNLNP
jgi:hypothetical protein